VLDEQALVYVPEHAAPSPGPRDVGVNEGNRQMSHRLNGLSFPGGISASGAAARPDDLRDDRAPIKGPVLASGGQTLFDDFSYTSHRDPALAAHGWRIRVGSGGPGIPGATWDPTKVTFLIVDGTTVMNLEASTTGTAQSRAILTKAQKFRNGTYAARVRSADTRTSGPAGDHLVQTFFTINDLTAPMADDYAKYDFEYLPNGGWGEPTNTLCTTSWETYQLDPWRVRNHQTKSAQSYADWRDLVLTIDDTAIAYYVDGHLFGTHDAAYLPERPMAINFDQWLIDLSSPTSLTPRTYDQQVDYILHVKDPVLLPAQIAAKVVGYRTAGTTYIDDVPATS
jgi:hypothetical protein